MYKACLTLVGLNETVRILQWNPFNTRHLLAHSIWIRREIFSSCVHHFGCSGWFVGALRSALTGLHCSWFYRSIHPFALSSSIDSFPTSKQSVILPLSFSHSSVILLVYLHFLRLIAFAKLWFDSNFPFVHISLSISLSDFFVLRIQLEI